MPATVLQFTVKNTGDKPLDCELGGILQNAVCLRRDPDAGGRRTGVVRRAKRNRVSNSPRRTEAEAARIDKQKAREPIVFADFEGETFDRWKVEGEAFGKGPRKGPTTPEQHLSNFQGKSLANSWTGSDQPHGKLISPEFKIERHFINFLIGGGNHPNETCINLIVDDRTVRTATGKNSDAMESAHWSIKELVGKAARNRNRRSAQRWLGTRDRSDRVCRSAATAAGPIEKEADFGTLALALLEPGDRDRGSAGFVSKAPIAIAAGNGIKPTEADYAPNDKMLGFLSRPLALPPGGESKVTFIYRAWYFPNLRMDRLPGGRFYATRFKSAGEVASHVAQNLPALAAQTRLWHNTWYDSTLPYWFLDRTLLNISILATSTCHWFADGRFYAWEGVNCCPGTCTHVWHYAQALARLFPSIEPRTPVSRSGVPRVPCRYLLATILVAVTDQSLGTSTSFCSKIALPLASVISAVRFSHSISS